MNNLADIYNFLDLSNSTDTLQKLATSGQPTIEQFTKIKAAGYQVVINLALLDSSNAVPTEPSILADLGLNYIHIPVLWENPTAANFDLFRQTMQQYADRSVYVHCAANMRVSAFIYLYRRIYQNMSAATALADLEKIWTPNPIWQKFMDEILIGE
jgi:protein tyrosine phosphatase (PTP) superfamily phosphohydrolase (DUF442 family)